MPGATHGLLGLVEHALAHQEEAALTGPIAVHCRLDSYLLLFFLVVVVVVLGCCCCQTVVVSFGGCWPMELNMRGQQGDTCYCVC